MHFITGPQLLNCQTQSHLSRLVVTPLGAKKSLVRQFGAGGISILLGHFHITITYQNGVTMQKERH